MEHNVHGGTRPDLLDFSASVNPLGLHPAAARAVASLAVNSSPLAAYPDSSCAELRSLLARFWRCDADCVVCGAGAVDIIYAIMQTVRGGVCAVAEPAFTEYRRAAVTHDCTVRHGAGGLDGADIFFLASPANPSGKIAGSEELCRIAARCERGGTVFVLDACFSQFSAKAEQAVRDLLSRREEFPHTVVLNAFTKFYGMAGLRLGYALCFSRELARRLSCALRPWAVDAAAQRAGVAVLTDELHSLDGMAESQWTAATRGLVSAERPRLVSALQGAGFHVEPGEANFILFRADDTGLEKKLLPRGIAVRSCADFFGLDSHWYRIAVRGAEDNARLISALCARRAAPPQRRMAASIMVQGTMSGAGKSLLTAALCRILTQDGYRVAPFKSQNMSLNSAVTPDGMEIGRAQAMQAECCGKLPDTRMNPVLLKPTGKDGSQVIVNGTPTGTMGARDYFAMRRTLMPTIIDAYRSLAAENDVIVIEGAGSPAEINLQADDIVNMGLAEATGSPVLLVGDIDRGGAFASLYGTLALLDDKGRRRIKGLVINKFRGDKSLLEGGLEQISGITGSPVLGVLPFMQMDIDDEDSLAPCLSHTQPDSRLPAVCVVRLPHISNFTDFSALSYLPTLCVRYVSSVAELERFCGHLALLVLPGTKSTLDDLAWLRETGLARLITELAARGTPVLGICGGFQMLGQSLLGDDNADFSGSKGAVQGLGLLECGTSFSRRKTLSLVRGTVPELPGFWGCVSGCEYAGYEIHHGITDCCDGGFQCSASGGVLGTYVHGLFDSDAVSRALSAALGAPVPDDFCGYARHRQAEYDRLAAAVRECLSMDSIYAILRSQADMQGEGQ